MAVSPEKNFKRMAVNRSVFHDYLILEKMEAGIALRGTEVKSLRAGNVSVAGSYAKVENSEVFLHNMNIQPYDHGNRFNHNPTRVRKLLLHRKEINRIRSAVEQKGQTVVPLSVHIRRGFVKVEIGICKGKNKYDKRETIRRKTADKAARKAVARYR